VGNDDRDSVSEDQIISNNEEEESDDDMESNDSQGKDVPSKNSGQQVDDDSVASGQSNSSSGEDDEDDLADVPDTREYVPVDVEGLAAMGLSQIGGVGGRMEFDDGDDDDASYLEDVRLTNDDAIVLVAKTEEVRDGMIVKIFFVSAPLYLTPLGGNTIKDFASLEVHVYDRKTGNLYVHHDIPLPAFPLCLAHGRVSSESSSGNFCAVGTFSPGIEVWNLDVLNALEPSCILGGEDTSSADEIMKLQMMRGGGGSRGASKKSKFSKTHKGGLRPGSHTDAVMALSWNAVHHQVIASGSADKTVKLFDVTKATSDDCNAATFTHHRDKVQSVEWHPVEGTLLATGSYDRSVALLDARSNGRDVKKVRIPSDCEAMAWDPFHTEYLTVACEDGTVNCWDVRRFETNHPAWSMLANEYGGISDVSFNKKVPGLLAFCSTDKTVSLWDTYSNSAQANQSRAHSGPPRLCGSKDMCSGKLYTVSFYPSDPWLLGCGGSGNQLALWDLSEEAAIQNRFGSLFNRGSMTESPQSPEARDTDFDAMMAPTVSSRDTRTASEHRKNKSKGKRSARKKVR
jgi:periodic tryptophan protein 1